MSATTIQPTLQNPAKPGLRSLLDALSEEIRKQVNCARPGIVQDFNSANGTATVLIAQQQVSSVSPTGVQTLAAFPLLVSVPVFILGGGGFCSTFPIAEGDECLVVFCDREIDNWLETGGANTTPTTQRIHDLADGMCFVGFRSYPNSLDGYSTDSAQLRTDDGTNFVEIKTGGIINITATTEINLNAPVTNISNVLGVLNSGSSSNPCNINGALKATGDIIAGSGTTDTSLQHHVHSGVTTGGSNTGQPV